MEFLLLHLLQGCTHPARIGSVRAATPKCAAAAAAAVAASPPVIYQRLWRAGAIAAATAAAGPSMQPSLLLPVTRWLCSPAPLLLLLLILLLGQPKTAAVGCVALR